MEVFEIHYEVDWFFVQFILYFQLSRSEKSLKLSNNSDK